MATTTSLSRFDAIQTFYVDAAATGYSSEVFLTSIELFFKNKENTGSSGVTTPGSTVGPGVVVSICEIDGETPNLNKIVGDSIVRVPYERVYTSSIDASIATAFIFNKPLRLNTNRFYGIVINYENPKFEIWYNKTGDLIAGTNIPSPGVNSARAGKFYNGASADSPRQAVNNVNLKYKVNVAKFTANTITAELVNKDFEFLSINSISGNFVPYEPVYKNVANSVGSLSIVSGNSTIIGTGTTFENLQVGQALFVLRSAALANAVQLTVQTINSNTNLIVAETPQFSNSAAAFKSTVYGTTAFFDSYKKKLYLNDSTANVAIKFANNDTVYGIYSGASATVSSVDNFRVDRFVPAIRVDAPSTTVSNNEYTFSYSNGSTYIVDTGFARPFNNDVINDVSRYPGVVTSRSNEVDNGYLYDTTARKSSITKMTFNVNQPVPQLFTTPFISADGIDFIVHQNQLITDSYTTLVNGVTYDTEVDKNGIALSKHISTKVSFANNRFAEDVRVIANIYRPYGTEVRVYCKIHNSSDPETFDDKQWSPLTILENASKYSSSEDTKDFIEVSYGLPKYAEVANTVPGTFTVSSGNTVLLCTNNVVNTYISANDVVRVYNELFPNNYFVVPVTASNTTTITIGTAQSNSSILGAGFKVDKLKYKHTAFNNPQNDNVCAYYNTAFSQFDRYSSMQIKIVLLSNQTRKYPKVNDISVIGVSA